MKRVFLSMWGKVKDGVHMPKLAVHKHGEIKQNLAYWLSRSPEERLEAVELLRRQMYGDTEGLQRVARVVQLS